jgi:hypothetical protein
VQSFAPNMYDPDFERNDFPIAYLITVRCYGTWLHGDDRLSVDRHGHDVYGTPRRAASPILETVDETQHEARRDSIER